MPVSYACPFCRVGLSERDDGLYCDQCRRRYAYSNGFPDFSTREHYWNQVTEEQMETLLEVAQRHGYRDAVDKNLAALTDHSLIGYVLGESRADFRAILPITPASRVLDLGPGWGAIACTMAPTCASYAAVDTNPHTLRFMQIRAEQSGLRNLHLARIDPLDDGRLPYGDDSFDAAIMNGVLEWVGDASRDTSPHRVQIRCLNEVRRVLKPGGVLYVGIENRYAYGYLFGARDHSRLRYTSLLPRFLASLVTRVKQGKPYRTYTYSYRGYKALLRSAGFATPDLYLPIPSYRDPEYILPAENDRAITYFMRRRASHIVDRTRRRIVETLFHRIPPGISCRLVRQMFYSFLMVAEARK